ncbi:MAG: CPBP family intramembrane metalloprotease [Planctomycetes bacterium]|jgi:membrane protease YdiL (CAAX protease family)|nr:CPBP family intramembrane metalloprotease [Planctomycetota bacterium]
MTDQGAPQPQRREERNANGVLVAEWWVIADAAGAEVHHGEFTAYHPNGQRREHGFYDYGQRVGPWYGWADDGRRIYDKIHAPVEVEPPQAEEPPAEAWNQPIEPSPPKPEDKTKAGLWVELLVVLALAWLPLMVSAALTPDLFVPAATVLDLPSGGEDTSEPATPSALQERLSNRSDRLYIFAELPMIANHIQVLAVMLFLLALRRHAIPLADAGLVRPRLVRDLVAAAVLFVLATGATFAAEQVLPSNDFEDYRFYPDAAAGYTVMMVSLVLNSVMEELVWRGYVMQRLIRLGASTTLAVVVSSGLFASYHLYQGPNAVGVIFIWGVIYALVFRLCRSIWPLVIAHTLHNVLVYTGAFEALGM